MSFSVNLMSRLARALKNAGFSVYNIKKLLSNSDLLKSIKDVVTGKKEIIQPDHIIDLDVDPFIPDGWAVEEHVKGGKFKFDPSKIILYFNTNESIVRGPDFEKELKDKLIFNANLLDYLLAHPGLIPEEWKGERIHFWGTICVSPGGERCIRYLFYRGRDQWGWGCDPINRNFFNCGSDNAESAAVRAA